MLGQLPRTLEVNGKEYAIRTDYRDCLTILSSFADRNLTNEDRVYITLRILYKEPLPQEDLIEAYNKAVWFLNCGDVSENHPTSAPIYSWEQDEQLIFSAVNKVAGKEIRNLEYMHFWSFIGLFNEIGEGSFSTVLSIRNKKRKNQPLEKWEKDFYREHKSMIDLEIQLTEEEKAEQEEVDKLLGI